MKYWGGKRAQRLGAQAGLVDTIPFESLDRRVGYRDSVVQSPLTEPH